MRRQDRYTLLQLPLCDQLVRHHKEEALGHWQPRLARSKSAQRRGTCPRPREVAHLLAHGSEGPGQRRQQPPALAPRRALEELLVE
eukprot:1923041-Pyramimonas_sp.AAC.1